MTWHKSSDSNLFWHAIRWRWPPDPDWQVRRTLGTGYMREKKGTKHKRKVGERQMQLERLVLVNGGLVNNQLSVWGELGYLHLWTAIIPFIPSISSLPLGFISLKECFQPSRMSFSLLMLLSMLFIHWVETTFDLASLSSRLLSLFPISKIVPDK